MPGIDRDFWLDFAKASVTNSIASREKAADKLDSLLMWIWGIYTSAFVVASLFNFISSNIWQLIWVAQPILIILISRYYCFVVSIPSTKKVDKTSVDPNDVPSIIAGFKFIIQDKKNKLRIAKILTLVSILSIIAAVVGYSFYDPNKELKHELQTLKLKEDLNRQKIISTKDQQLLNDSIRNDSIKSLGIYYDFQIQNLIKERKLKCLDDYDIKGFNSLKLLEK